MTVRREREMAERLHEAIADQKNAYYVHDLNRSVLADAILANGAVFLPDAAELDRLRRIEAAARRLDRAYGPRSVGMVWTATQEMIDAWRELQEAAEGSARDGG